MAELPRTRQEKLEYLEARVDLWETNAERIGITAAQVTALTNAVTSNRGDFGAMLVARDAAKAATNTFYTSNNTLVTLGRDLIKTIKAFAQTAADPMIYSLANIDPPAPPTPVPAPSVPTDFTGYVTPDGVVTLTWKATPAGPTSGVFFIVERKRAGAADYSILTATMEKGCIDPAAHVGLSQVQYRVKAVRGATESDWCTPVSFNFGAGGGMGAAGFAAVAPMKLAA